ncbi:MAG: ATP-dependent helicase HrpB [Thalassotalea sp.]
MTNDLPISAYLPEILHSLSKKNNLVLQAEPGAGKSTAVPLSLLDAEFLHGKKIVLLEPRRIAVKSIANYLAKQLGEKVGQRIGYQIRNERKTTNETVLEIVTEGVLTRRLQKDPELADTGLIIFDEFHERSIHADLALMLALEVQDAYREDLKLLVMSATIDSQQISNYLKHAPIIQCPGRTFPVDIEYIGKPTFQRNQPFSQPIVQQIIKALQLVLNQLETGDVLVFLPGQADIKKCQQAATASFNSAEIDFLPLYGGLPLTQQELVLNRNEGSKQRVIFATNIAETSLTIAGITTVIDSGLEKTLSFDVKSGLSRLETTYISKASATQRAGRAGRLQRGRCLRLWSETEHFSLNDFQPEEIVSSNLAGLVLDLAAWGITTFADVNWLTPPPVHHFEVACQLNIALGLMAANNKITAIGKQALSLGVEPRLASMLLTCDTIIEKKISCLLAALLAERDIFFNADNSDITERAIVLIEHLTNQQSQRGHSHKPLGVNSGALAQVTLLVKSFARTLSLSNISQGLTLALLHQHVGALLLKAYPDCLAKIRHQESYRYILANGRGVTLRDTDSLQGETWLVVADCDAKNKDGLVYLSAAISLTVIKTALASQFIEQTDYTLDSKKEKIIGRQYTRYRALEIENKILTNLSQVSFENCLRDIINQEGLSFLNWTTKCADWLSRAQWLAEQLESFPKLSQQTLIAQLECWLLPYITKVKSIKQLKQLPIFDLLTANLTWPENQFLDQHAPVSYVAPSGKSIAIRYDEHQGPTVAVVLQEMFGQLSSPTIAQGKVPLRFELLSPAKRPIQTTSDIANFWTSSYFAVIKDMRAKYPKHRWPEAPLLEKPGRSIKARTFDKK